MNVIIEGCDCQGKSTLASRLHNKHLFDDVIHFTSFKDNLGKHDHMLVDGIPIMNQIRDVVMKHQSQSMIYDRFIYSDIVYAPLYRKDNITRDIERDYLELLMESLGTIYIYVESSHDASKMIDDDNDGHVNSQNFRSQVLDKYHELNDHVFDAFGNNVITYDWASKQFGTFLDILVDKCEDIKTNFVYKQTRHYEEIFRRPYLGTKWLGSLSPSKSNIFITPEPEITYDTYLRLIATHPELKGRTDFALVSYDNTGLVRSLVEHISRKE